jgi:hypothetical protein
VPLLVAGLLLAIYAGSLLRSSPTTASIAGFVEPRIDLGSQAWGAEAPFTLTFHNGEAEDIAIAKVDSSCSCTVLDQDSWSGRVIPPGDSLEMSGLVDAGERPGRFVREITVTDQRGRSFVAAVELTVAQSYSFTPDRLEIPILPDSPDVITENIRFASETVALEGDAYCEAGWAHVVQVAPDALALQVFPKRVLATGRSHTRIVVHTTDTQIPTYTIPIAVQRLSHVNVYPPRAWLIGSRSRRLHVTDMLNQPLAVTVSGVAEGFRIDTSEPGFVLIEYVGDAEEPIRTTCTLQTASGSACEVPISWSPLPSTASNIGGVRPMNP